MDARLPDHHCVHILKQRLFYWSRFSYEVSNLNLSYFYKQTVAINESRPHVAKLCLPYLQILK